MNEKLDRLHDIVHTMASSVVAHDNKIEAPDRQIAALIDVAQAQGQRIKNLIQASEAQRVRLDELKEETWRAICGHGETIASVYNTLPRQLDGSG